MTEGRKFCVGQFAGAHGVRGLVKLRCFMADPDTLFSFDPLLGEDGRVFKITLNSSAKDHLLVTVEGINDREEAEALRGDRLYIPRALLPKTGKNEYYDSDLMGLRAADAEGKDYGRILGVFDYGGGPFLEIGNNKKDSFMLPFKDAYVPEIDLERGKATIVMPEDWLNTNKPRYIRPKREETPQGVEAVEAAEDDTADED